MQIKKNQGSDNLPALRFPEFEGAWEKKKLGEVAKFSKGKGISKADIVENGNIECIRYGELYTHYGETIDIIKSKTNIDAKNLVFSQANDVIIPASGETQIDIATASCVLKSGVALGGDLNIIKTENNDGVWLSYYLNSKRKLDIANLAQGISVVHLYSSQLALLNLSFPTLPEQTKIANFLTVVDEKLQALKKKKNLLEEYKKGVMQSLFCLHHDSLDLHDEHDLDIDNAEKKSRQSSKSQKSRFRQDDGSEFPDWEVKKLGEVLNYEQPTNYLVSSTEYDDKFKTPVVTAGKTFILGYTEEVKGIFKDNLPVIIFDDFTTATQFVNFPFKAKSSAMKILKAKENTNIKFIYEAMQMINYEIGGHGRHWISVFAEMKISIPSLPEQTKIANFLSAIDDKINHTETQIQQTQEWKKGLLQKMFC